MVRIAAAICSIVFVILFAWVVVDSFGPAPVVVPTGGVVNGGPKDTVPSGKGAEAALAKRTELQRWRAVSGPSPSGEIGAREAQSGEPMTNAASGAVQDGAARVRTWLAARGEDWPVLAEHGFTKGLASLPADRDSVLMQPQGRDFRRAHTGWLSDGGGWIIFGVSLLLSLFLLLRGRIRIKEGFSDIKIERFDALERANHWMTAVSFIVLALTGLVLLYGRYLLEPWMGAGAFSGLASACLYLHIAFMPPFLIGAILMLALWLPQQIPNSADMRWLARFGGFLTPSKPNPPAYRFNAGQKIVFWGVLWGTFFAALSGFTLMFPFYWADITTMQWVLVAHAVVALLMIALILGHIYIGTIGMEGAFEAMWYGHVDRNWAAEHHRYWLDEQEREGRVRPDRPGVAPAE